MIHSEYYWSYCEVNERRLAPDENQQGIFAQGAAFIADFVPIRRSQLPLNAGDAVEALLDARSIPSGTHARQAESRRQLMDRRPTRMPEAR